MSSPAYDFLAIDVPLVEAFLVEREGSDDQAEFSEIIPVAVLDFGSSTEGALLMMEWLDRDDGSLELGSYPEVWEPMPGMREPDAYMKLHPSAPTVRIVIAPTAHPEAQEPVPVLAFRVPIMDFGTFMAQASEARFLAVTPASEHPDDDSEAPPPGILGALNDPDHMAWIELTAWRRALSVSSPAAYQRSLPLP